MTMSLRPLQLSAALLLMTSLTAGGCSSGKTQVCVSPVQSSQKYVQEFPVAYSRHNAAGDVDVVLTSDFSPSGNRSGDRTTGPVGADAGRLRQVMHVRVLWQPMKGTKTDSPTATNATLSWFVFGDDGRGQTRMIEYSGAAFVDVTRKGGETILAVRNASLKPTGRVGDLNDPIGPARIDGKIVAKNNTRRVGDLLNDTRASVGAAQASARIVSQKGASSQLPQD